LLHRVELPTVRDTTIVCWYYVPRDAFDAAGRAVKRCPAIVIMPGYGAEEPPVDRTDKGMITLSVNPRNHGPSKEFWTAPVEHMTYNLEDPENYYYKLAYLDCLRGAQFVFSRGEVDAAHVAAEGGSQGGLFALALAALEPRIACVCSNVTAFTDYPDGMMLARIGHHAGFRKRLAEASPAGGEKLRLSLQYTDGVNMAGRVRCPVQFNMGGQDPVCPYPCGIVAFNRLPPGVEKEFNIVPDAKHEVPPSMRENNMRWYRRWLGIKRAN
jgi:cephalosporin-C deacetylase